jgi:hypothetical protein
MAGMPTVSHRVLLAAGPVVWAVHFLAIYGFTGIVCARPGVDAAVLAWGVALAGVAAIALLALVVLAARRAGSGEGERPFALHVGQGLAAFAALAIAWETLPVFLAPPCL